jgi:hypothetical protein
MVDLQTAFPPMGREVLERTVPSERQNMKLYVYTDFQATFILDLMA